MCPVSEFGVCQKKKKCYKKEETDKSDDSSYVNSYFNKRLSFGKYKGKTIYQIETIDEQYIKWLCTTNLSGWLKPTLKKWEKNYRKSCR